MYWEQVVRSDDHWVMLRWCLSLRNRCSHSEIATTNSWCGMTAACAVCLMRWFNGKRSLANTSPGKTKVSTSFLLSCERATPTEGFIIHQLETAQCWFHHGGIKPKKKKRKLSQPHKTSEIKEAILQSCNENQRHFFFIAAHLTTVEPRASVALKRWQIRYQTTVLRQIKTRIATFRSPGGGKG